MAFTHANSLNKFGVAKLIVATDPANGSHITLASAIADASAGDTIFLRDSVTENVTLTIGVNLAAWEGSAVNTPSITGKITITGAGTSTISGITLITNSDNILSVGGSSATILNVTNCYLKISNNTGISFTTASASSKINFYNCTGDLGTTGIAVYTMSATGAMNFSWCFITNSGTSVTASSNSAGSVQMLWSPWQSPVSTSSTGTINFENCNCQSSNTAFLTTAGTGSGGIIGSGINSGSASAISIGAGTTVTVSRSSSVTSSNTNAITGAGTLQYSPISFFGTSSTVNTTTQTPFPIGPLITSLGQPSFLFYLNSNTAASLTGDGTAYVLGTDALTQSFQQGSGMSTNGTFTAPVAGKYFFHFTVDLFGILVTHTNLQILFTGPSIWPVKTAPFVSAVSGEQAFSGCTVCSLAAAATVQITITATGGTKVIGLAGVNSGNMRTFFGGHLIC